MLKIRIESLETFLEKDENVSNVIGHCRPLWGEIVIDPGHATVIAHLLLDKVDVADLIQKIKGRYVLGNEQATGERKKDHP